MTMYQVHAGAPGSQEVRGKKKPLELEFQTVVSSHVGGRDWTRTSGRTEGTLDPSAIFPASVASFRMRRFESSTFIPLSKYCLSCPVKDTSPSI